MVIDPNWVSAISNLIVATSVVFVGMQVKISIAALRELKTQRKHDHERSRRENAVKLLQDWTGHNTSGEPSARFIVEKFTPEECQKLIRLQPFYVSSERAVKIKHALFELPHVKLPEVETDKGILLNEDLLFHLGRLCHNYLSSLEVILIAWSNSTADEDIFEQQLCFIVKPALNFYCLKNFRDAMGGTNAYPNIQAFVEKISAKLSVKAHSKEPL